MKTITKCPKCRKISCGDDKHTKSPYRGPERHAGDRGKVVLLQIYDWFELDGLQIAEIKALLNILCDEHLEEEDLA